MATVLIPDSAIPKACRPISNKLILEPESYNSGESELKDLFGYLITLNTINCNIYKFSYSQSVTALKISDNNKISMTNFVKPVNGATTSGDYLSIFTTDYNNSPYNVTVVLTATISGKVLM
jgi:hypothetical protein